MKRNWHFLLTVILGVLLLGSVMGEAAPAAPAAQVSSKVYLQATDHGRQVVLNGQMLVINLESNPSTGYGWEVNGLNNNILRQVGVDWKPHNPGLLGAPGTTSIRFAGVAAGKVRLDMAYRRPWEKDRAPMKTFTVYVEVAKPTPYIETPEPKAEGPVSGIGASEGVLSLSTSFNWCDNNACPDVREQGACGSCWAFATVGPLESAIRIKDTTFQDLSEQYLVSCNYDGWSCSGGWFAHDYHQWKCLSPPETEAGAVWEENFPYTATNGSCGEDSHTHHEKIADWAYVNSNVMSVPTVEAIKQAIYDHGPVSAAVCVDTAFQVYDGGVFNPRRGCRSINHGIVLVGWNDADGAWILRNSWGPNWGENGYMRIAYGKSLVG